jgi:hypothetical protein
MLEMLAVSHHMSSINRAQPNTYHKQPKNNLKATIVIGFCPSRNRNQLRATKSN